MAKGPNPNTLSPRKRSNLSNQLAETEILYHLIINKIISTPGRC